VLCSPARRTVDTLEILRGALKPSTRVEVEESLYLAHPDRLAERIQQLPETVASAMLVGHNPAMQDLAVSLGKPSAVRERAETKFPPVRWQSCVYLAGRPRTRVPPTLSPSSHRRNCREVTYAPALLGLSA